MFRAQVLWLENGPTLKLQGKLVGDWAKEAMRLVTADVIPEGLVVDLTEVTYIEPSGECLLSWLGGIGAKFLVTGVYTAAICERFGLPIVQRMSSRRYRSKEEKSFDTYSHARLMPLRATREKEE